MEALPGHSKPGEGIHPFGLLRVVFNLHPYAARQMRWTDDGINIIYSKPDMRKYRANIYAPFVFEGEIIRLESLYHEN